MRLGRAVQWGTVRLPGTFLTEEPAPVPASVMALVAGQLVEDAEHFADYGAPSRRRTSSPVGDPGRLRLPGLRRGGARAAGIPGGPGAGWCPLGSQHSFVP